MAAGKSTTAEALALKLDKCVHLRGDVFRRMIASGKKCPQRLPKRPCASFICGTA